MTPAAAAVAVRYGLWAFSRRPLPNARTARIIEVNSHFASGEASPAFSDCNDRSREAC